MNPITPLTPQQTEAAAQNSLYHGYLVRVLDALDKLGATLMGQPSDTTISSDEGIAALKDHGFVGEQAKLVADVLNIFQHNHCAKAIAGQWAQGLQASKEAEASGAINQDPQG